MKVDLVGLLRLLTIGSWRAWVMVGGVVAACTPAVWLIISDSTSVAVERSVRVGSMCLQLLGLAIVAYGLHKTRVQFGKDGWGKRLHDYGRKLSGFFLKPKPIAGTIHVVEGNRDSCTVFGTPIAIRTNDLGLDERMTSLEANFQTLLARINRNESQTHEEFNRIESALHDERLITSEETRRVLSKLEDFSTGGLDLEWMGLVWLFVGTVLGSLSQEIATSLT